MKLLCVCLIVFCVIGVSLAYTLPGHTVKGNIDMYGNKVINSTTPVNDTDLSTKKYVDDSVAGGTVVPSDLWTKINKSGDTMSGVLAMGSNKITGVANGTAAQDSVALSQLQQPGSNITYDGYVQSGSLRPQTKYQIFRYTLPWTSLGATVALRDDGWPVSIGDNVTVIQAALDAAHAAGGGQIELCCYFTGIDTTLTQYADSPITGLGDKTGLEGTANPLLLITRHSPGESVTVLSDIRIRTVGASNDGVQSYAGANNIVFEDVYFTTDGSSGCILNLTWWNNGKLSHCTFSQEDADYTGEGLKIWGSGSSYCSINQFIESSTFSYFDKPINVSTDDPNYLTGVFLTDCTLGWSNYGLYVNGAGSVYVDHAIIDGAVMGGIVLENFIDSCITNSWIAVTPAGGTGIYISTTDAPCYRLRFSGNFLYDYNATPSGWAILVDSASDSNALNSAIINNNMINHWVGGIKFGNSGTADHNNITISGNNIETCSYSSAFFDNVDWMSWTGGIVGTCGAVQYVDVTNYKVHAVQGVSDASNP